MVPNRKRSVQLFIIFVALQSIANSIMIGPTYAPIDRLLRNTESYLTENTHNPEAYYALARIHYFAFAYGVGFVAGGCTDSFASVADDWYLLSGSENVIRPPTHEDMLNGLAKYMALDSFDACTYKDVVEENREKLRRLEDHNRGKLKQNSWEARRFTPAESQMHAVRAYDNFRLAIKLDSSNSLYWLGIASFYEQYLDFRLWCSETFDQDSIWNLVSDSLAVSAYLKSYVLTIEDDLKKSYLPISGLYSIIGYDAGSGFMRMCKRNKGIAKTYESELKDVRVSLKKLEGLEYKYISPIIFSFEQSLGIHSLLSDNKVASFDLDGNGIIESWNWVKPTTGFLVWDPDGTGVIASGRQLFGNATWWMFYPNGYRALDALDDDRNGYLEGEELIGIRVWFDRDSDGVSDAGEVVSLESLNIVALGVRHTGAEGIHLVHDRGAILKDGTVIKTYDWVTSPVVE